MLRLITTGIIGLLGAWLVIGLGRWGWLRLSSPGQRTLLAVTKYALLVVFGLVFVGPFLWMFSTSLKVDTQIFSERVQWFPTVPTVQAKVTDSNGIVKEAFAPIKRFVEGGKEVRVAVLEETEDGKSRIRPLEGGGAERLVEKGQLQEVSALAPQWHNFPDALSSFPFVRYTLNTLLICILTMIGTTFSAALPAYGFSRLRWKGRDALFFLLIATIMLPPQVTMIPVFLIFRALGWTGTILPLVIPSFFGSAFYVFMLRQFFLTIPQELSDAARIDGCNEWAILWRILAPMARPALVTVALLSFTAAWMDFTGPLIYLHDEQSFTLAIGLLAFLGRHGSEWSLLMAAATVLTLPMLLLFFLAQRTYIQGIALTGMKG